MGTAKALAKQGYTHVTLVARGQARLDKAAEQLRALGATCDVIATDLTQPGAVEALQLLDMHPAVLAADAGQQVGNLGHAVALRRLLEQEAGAEMVDQESLAADAGPHLRAAVADGNQLKQIAAVL